MAIHPAKALLMKAHVHPLAYSTNLAKEGYNGLSDLIVKGENVVQGIPVSFYIQPTEPDPEALSPANHLAALDRTHRLAALMARELCLNRQKVVMESMAGLLREYRIAYLMEREVKPLTDTMGLKGDGYIVVDDLFVHDSPSDVYGCTAVEDIGNWLMNHVYDGGGLILAGRPLRETGINDFGSTFRDFIQSRFTTLTADK